MIEAGGKMKIEVSSDDLVLFADRLIEKAMEAKALMMEQTPEDETWLSTDEIAKICGVTKALTREYGLTFGKGKRDVRRSHLKGRDAVKYQLYDTISAVLSHCHDWQTLRTALAARGVTMNLVQGDDGRICGITFTDLQETLAGVSEQVRVHR